jgi:exodeoxyribonuclease VII large subunit
MQKATLAIQEAFPRTVWVIGEIQNLNRRPSGLFLQLAELKEGASRSATMTVNTTFWASQQKILHQKLGRDQLNSILQDGMKVRILAQVNLYRDRGQLSLNLLDIDPRYTKGALALAREEILRELRQKGLDRKNAQLPLPAFPLRIGLISADESRAKSDFLHQLLSYRYPGDVLFYPAQMQGENTIQVVCDGMEQLQTRNCDLIVVTRGGGSLADLRWFDSKEIAVAIAHSKVPVIAAIGHQDDVCVAEECAARREKTPTAAADFILALCQATRERLDQASQSLGRRLQEALDRSQQQLVRQTENLKLAVQQRLSQYAERLHSLSFNLQQTLDRQVYQVERQLHQYSHQLQSLVAQNLNQRLRTQAELRHELRSAIRQRLESSRNQSQRLAQSLYQHITRQLHSREQQLNQFEKALVRHDPSPWLERGWTRLSLTTTGKSVKSIEDVALGTELQAMLRDGRLTLIVDHKESLAKPSTQGEHDEHE